MPALARFCAIVSDSSVAFRIASEAAICELCPRREHY